MQARVNTYLQAVAPLGREAGRIGPFLATCTPTSDNPYLNYAIPEDGAEPGGEDVFDLEAWFAHRHRKPRLEYVTAAAPAVEAVLLAAGFAVEGRLPLMVWDTHATTDLAPIDGVEVVLARSDDDLFDMMAVQAEAYESSAPPSRDDVGFARGAVERGAIAVVARDLGTGAAVGAGRCSPVVTGLAEVAAIGVVASHRRRGIAGALARRLAREATDNGADSPFLMAAHETEARSYERAGFVRISEILHISK